MRLRASLLVALAVCGCAVAAEPAAAFMVTGYAVDAPAIAAARGTVSDVGVDGATISRGGGAIVTGADQRAGLAAAHAATVPAALLVSNYDARIDDFSPAIGRRLLRSARHRRQVVAALAAEVLAGGWDGVTIDLESLARGDRAGLVALASGLRAALPAGRTLDVDLPAADGAADGQWAPFDVPALARIADHVVLMAYDEHYAGGPAGPVAGLPWVGRVLRTALAVVPANRLRLGVAGYGYRWRRGHATASVSTARARALAGRRARWSASQGEWHARLADSSVLWWSDARSLAQRFALARAAGLQGVALWRLGLSDPLPPI